MLDLLIINPPSLTTYGGLDSELVACEPPLWCRLIAGYIRDQGFSVEILDAEAGRFTPNTVASLVDAAKPRLACIAAYGHQPSASTQQMAGAGAVARAIKHLVGSECQIIMVGGHVSALPKRTMCEETIDYACIGEGPVTIAHLLGGSDLEDIPGLVYRDAGKDAIYANPSAPLIDVAQLHGNAWDLLPMDKYRAHNWQCLDGSPRQPYASVYTSLGCPYKCSFCCINAPFESNKYRMRAPADVVREIELLYDTYGVRTFKIVDEMFILNERHYTAIAEGLIASGFGSRINIWAYARVDTVKTHTLNMLRKAGFRWLALGIESGSKHVRDGAQKALKHDDIHAIANEIRKAGINVIGNYIFGLPDDTYESMLDTLNLAMTLNTEFANFYSAMAYPGSKLYEEAVKAGTGLPATWSGYSQHSEDCFPLRTEKLTATQVLAFRDAAFYAYFTNSHYLNRIDFLFGKEARDQIVKMASVKLKRKLLQERALV